MLDIILENNYDIYGKMNDKIKPFKSIKFRLVYILVLMTVALTIIALVSITNSVQSSYYKTFRTRIEKGFNEWRLNDNPTQEEIEQYLIEDKNAIFLFSITEYKSYTILDKNSNDIIYSSDKLFETDKEMLLTQIQKSSNYIAALAEKVGDRDKLLTFKDKSYLDYAKAEGDYILYFRYDRDDWQGTIEQFNRIIYLSFGIAILASLIVGYLLSKTITKPIIDIMKKAQNMAQGEFEEELKENSDDEIGQLTKTFNYMAKELKVRLTEVQKEKKKIETILQYMTDGVIAFNKNGTIIHVNSISKHILDMANFEVNFYDFVERFNLDITLDEISKLKPFETIEKNCVIADRFIKIQIVNYNEGSMFIIQDITKQQKLDNMRKDFVANVSHELRTPLTSIKGYTEALIDGGMSDLKIVNKFLSVIDSETNRMIRLINDLLQLTRIDNNKIKWNKREMDLNKLVEFIVYKMDISMKEKELSCKVNLNKNISTVFIDKDRIEQVIINILSNSIKYTLNKGKIKVSTGEEKDYVKVEIEDTGIGIPKEDLPRICERFYRVDKARSRQLGGTGLGLSIAKEILEQHNGKVEIKSKVNKGTIVTIYLPKYKKE